MAFPIVPAILAVGAVAWAWWLGKNSTSKSNVLDLEGEIVETAVELLPIKEGGSSASDTPAVLSKIAQAIADTGASGPEDLEKVMNNLDSAARERVPIVVIAMEFLQWMEKNKKPEYSSLALLYRPDIKSRSSAIPSLELDDVYASARKWLEAKKQAGEISLPIELAKECGCKNGKGGPKKLFNTREKADSSAKFWLKKEPQRPQESYKCPKGKGYHLRTKKKPN